MPAPVSIKIGASGVCSPKHSWVRQLLDSFRYDFLLPCWIGSRERRRSSQRRIGSFPALEIVADQAKTKPKLQQGGSPKTQKIHSPLRFTGHQRVANTVVPMERAPGGLCLTLCHRVDLNRGSQFPSSPATLAPDLDSLETSGGLFQMSAEHWGQGVPEAPHPHPCVPVHGCVG